MYVCEFKFNRTRVGSEIIDEMKEKIRRLIVPKGMAIIPVLFHLGEVSEKVFEDHYFYRIIDINGFFESNNNLI